MCRKSPTSESKETCVNMNAGPIYLSSSAFCVAGVRVLQCLVLCCSVLQCVAVCCHVMQCVASVHLVLCCSVLQCIASVLQRVAGVRPVMISEVHTSQEHSSLSKEVLKEP